MQPIGTMDRANKVAALANAVLFDADTSGKIINGSPHIKHASLRTLYGRLVVQVFDFASKTQKNPKVLDLGAGEGSVTLPFLELGAEVTAIDISEIQLQVLQARCAQFKDRLTVRCDDVETVLRLKEDVYDIIVANSFLHHIPNYLGMIEDALAHIKTHGQFFSFQDPLQYNRLGIFTTMFNNIAYYSWRIFEGDFIRGLGRFIRRKRSGFLEDCKEDNAEFHVVRGGVDEKAIIQLLDRHGFDCEIVRYYSTQSRFFQFLGTLFGLESSFAILGKKRGN